MRLCEPFPRLGTQTRNLGFKKTCICERMCACEFVSASVCECTNPFPELENSPEIWFFIGGGRWTLKLCVCVVKADCCCAKVICGGRAAFRRGLPCVDPSVLMGARREPKTDGGAADPAAAKAGESLMVPIGSRTEPKPPNPALDATSTAAEAAGEAA